MPGVRAGHDLGAVEVPGQRLIEDVGHEGGLPRAGDAGHRDEQAERELDREVLEIVRARADEPEQPLPDRRAAGPAAPGCGARRGGTAP